MCIFPDMEILTFTQKRVELPFNPPEQFQGKEENMPIVLEFQTF